MMNKYSDLECSILSCILIRPKLIEETILKDEHFVNYQRVWKFMKSFYKKFGNFDLTIMCSICKEQYKLMQCMIDLLEQEPTTQNFKLYEKQLIDLYNEEEKDKWIIKKVYEETCDLWTRNITTKEFKEKVDSLYLQAEKIFENN